MTIALVTSGQGYSNNLADTFTTTTYDTTGADLLYVIVGSAGNNPPGVTLSDSKSNTWTQLTLRTGGVNKHCLHWYAQNATVGTGHTFTAAGTDIFAALCFLAFSGTDLTAPFDVENGNTQGFASSSTTGSVTPGQDNSVLVTGIGGYNSSSGATVSIDSSFVSGPVPQQITNTDFGHQGAAISYQIQTTATTRNPTWTINASDGWGAVIAVFKPDSGPPPPEPPLAVGMRIGGTRYG